ncbi:hypothetical protein WDU99_03620 [Microbacterium sp. Mu-80]|uniref:D-inositol 3-phosphate glycosyltransferase n=1 Tax=Microbacterium bandirmense TaxID=3122050 RepID=A0ABU8LAN5_9MICO
MTTPRILCISFSDINSDSRVLRQLDVLREFGEVTTLSYGTRPMGAAHHLEIPRSLPSLPQTPTGILNLVLRRFRAVEMQAPALAESRRLLGDREFDIVVANEARALPIAFRVDGVPRIWCDLHEWAPGERTHVLAWKILVAPFMRWVCAEYLPQVDVSTTINDAIATMYQDAFDIEPEIVRNAIAHRADLEPTPMLDGVVRLVHSGGAVPGRNIEAIIDAVDILGAGYTLDLYLIASRQADSYWLKLQKRIDESPRTTLHPPVSPDRLPDTLNDHDLGVFVLPPHTANHRYMLPNKFFDFVQARLGLVFGPSAVTDRLIEAQQLGVVTAGYSGQDVAAAIAGVSRSDIAAFKNAADVAAKDLSSDRDVAVERAILTRLAPPPS